VVDEHPDPPLRSRLERDQVVGEVVDTAQVLDDDTLDPQVVTPDLLDQLGVVTPLALTLSTATEPDAVRVGFAGAARVTGGVRMTGLPSSQKPGPSGNVRRLPCRSSRVSVCRSRSIRTISPTKSVSTSSTTVPSSAGVSTARPFLGLRQSPASTSEP
jgi:hypothetical protein